MLFGREPAALLGVLQAALGIVSAFFLPLTDNQVGVIMALAGAIAAAVVEWRTHSSLDTVNPTVLMGVVQAATGLAIAFGADLSTQQTGVILAATAAILSLLTRQAVAPKASPHDHK